MCSSDLKYSLDHPFILAVGSLELRKNLGRLVQAWKFTRDDLPDLDLVIVGTGGAAFRRVDFREVPVGVHLLGRVEDEDLVSLYTATSAYVQPSLYEGFGLTVLEAMACGAPVIAASAGALPELVGQAALLVDPSDIEAIGQAICQTVQDTELRQGLIQRGFERSGEASWAIAASEVWTSIQLAATYYD